MNTMRFIDGIFTKGEPILCRDFIDLKPGDVVWAKAATEKLDGPFQVMHRYEKQDDDLYPTFVITDADAMGIYVNFPHGLGMNTNCGFVAAGVGQINFFRAVPQNLDK